MANLNVQKIEIGGRLTADPELKVTQSGNNVCHFCVAVRKKKSTNNDNASNFYNVTAWNKVAETVSKYFRKGSTILVHGTPDIEKYTDRNGVEKEGFKITADEVYFVDSKNEAPAQIQTAKAEEHDPYANDQKFEEIGSDEDLPF